MSGFSCAICSLWAGMTNLEDGSKVVPGSSEANSSPNVSICCLWIHAAFLGERIYFPKFHAFMHAPDHLLCWGGAGQTWGRTWLCSWGNNACRHSICSARGPIRATTVFWSLIRVMAAAQQQAQNNLSWNGSTRIIYIAISNCGPKSHQKSSPGHFIALGGTSQPSYSLSLVSAALPCSISIMGRAWTGSLFPCSFFLGFFFFCSMGTQPSC